MYQHKAHPQSEAHWVSLFLDEHSEMGFFQKAIVS